MSWLPMFLMLAYAVICLILSGENVMFQALCNRRSRSIMAVRNGSTCEQFSSMGAEQKKNNCPLALSPLDKHLSMFIQGHLKQQQHLSDKSKCARIPFWILKYRTHPTILRILRTVCVPMGNNMRQQIFGLLLTVLFNIALSPVTVHCLLPF